MMDRSRQAIVWITVVVWSLVVATGCAPEFEGATCETDDDCFEDERCIEGVCRVADELEPAEDTGMPSEVTEGEPSVLLVSPKMVEVAVGHDARLHATVLDEAQNELESTEIEWSSSDDSIAAVAPASEGEGETDPSTGVLTAKATGSATITATLGDLSATATVEVVQTEVDRVVVAPEAPELEVGSTVEMSATVYDPAGNELTDRQVTWESTNTEVATVDENGNVEAVTVGEADIVAAVEDVETQTTATVIETPVASVSIAPEEPDALAPGETLQLVAIPENADGEGLCSEEDARGTAEPCGRPVTWTSGASSIATVGSEGTVTAEATGSVRIFADVEGKTGSIELDIAEGNRGPTADAGQDKTVVKGNEVMVDGSGSSDPDGDSLSFTWEMTTKPGDSNVTFGTVSNATASLMPDVAGTYTLKLTVSDGDLTAEDTIDIEATNQTPMADAGSDQSVHVGSAVDLDGNNSSDPDGDSLNYSWQVVDQPAGASPSLSDDTTATPTLTPDIPGTFEVELTVDDGNASASDTVVVTATNQAPTADAGSDATTQVGDSVTLDASNSSDPDGDTLSYSWQVIEQPSGASPTWSNQMTDAPTLTPDTSGFYTVQLTVDDGYTTATDTVAVVANNEAPVVDAGADKDVDVGDQVSLDASGSSDPDGDTLTYSSWSFDSKPGSSTATLGSTSGATTAFTPDVTGEYVVQFEVTDGDKTVTGTVTVTAHETPAASGDVVISEVMSSPAALSDANGEWFELHNPTSTPWNLNGCTIEDVGTTSHSTTVGSDLRVEPGGYVTLASSANPGFSPDYNYAGALVLEDDSDGDKLAVTCGSTEVDAVSYDGGTNWPATEGKSKTLSSGSLDASANDDGTNWCNGSSAYGNIGDEGTPGEANDSCP
jgi:uncharacterized protein YjdB